MKKETNILEFVISNNSLVSKQINVFRYADLPLATTTPNFPPGDAYITGTSLNYNQFVTNLLSTPVNIQKIVFSVTDIANLTGKNLRMTSTNIMGQLVDSPFPLSSSISPYQIQGVAEYNPKTPGELCLDGFTYLSNFNIPAGVSYDMLLYFNYVDYADFIKGVRLQDGLANIRTINVNETID